MSNIPALIAWRGESKRYIENMNAATRAPGRRENYASISPEIHRRDEEIENQGGDIGRDRETEGLVGWPDIIDKYLHGQSDRRNRVECQRR